MKFSGIRESYRSAQKEDLEEKYKIGHSQLVILSICERNHISRLIFGGTLICCIFCTLIFRYLENRLTVFSACVQNYAASNLKKRGEEVSYDLIFCNSIFSYFKEYPTP